MDDLAHRNRISRLQLTRISAFIKQLSGLDTKKRTPIRDRRETKVPVVCMSSLARQPYVQKVRCSGSSPWVFNQAETKAREVNPELVPPEDIASTQDPCHYNMFTREQLATA
nr:hypothetical protein BgiMline_032521 [Biomphalaria glabrata]